MRSLFHGDVQLSGDLNRMSMSGPGLSIEGGSCHFQASMNACMG